MWNVWNVWSIACTAANGGPDNFTIRSPKTTKGLPVLGVNDNYISYQDFGA